MSHRYKNKYCVTCQASKLHAKPARSKGPVLPGDAPPEFGDQVTADHLVVNDFDKGRGGERAAIVVYDRSSRWLSAYPVADKSADEAFTSLSYFAGHQPIKSFYSDNSPELLRATRDLGWPHTTSTPGRPDCNGVAERAVRTAVEGARTLLLHAGLPECWWPMAMRHFSVARNVEKVDGDSAWLRRFGGRPFNGHRIPFGALVEFKPSPTRDALSKFAPRAVPGIFLGYVLQPGCQWKGDYYAAALSEFQAVDGGRFEKVSVQRIKEVVPPAN
jgi:hypothetical protein